MKELTEWHFTCCANCSNIMAFSNGFNKYKIMLGQDYREHIGKCQANGNVSSRGVFRIGIGLSKIKLN